MNSCQLLLGLQIISQISLNIGYSPEDCTDAETCSHCMRAHYTCKWCKDEEYTAVRCQSNSTVLQVKLPDCEEWTFPVSETNKSAQDFSNTTQVKPSRIEITYLRPGEEKEIAITVKSSKGFPLDVYYLMDFSYSMKNDLNQLKNLSDSVVESLTDVSSSYGIGFGTFVDKPTFPFANSEPGRIEMPCVENEICQAVHSFNHEMDITSCKEDEESCQAKADFTERLNDIKISANIDVPEGGFDAIVQAAVCSKIGWRTVARRVLFFATDAVFHMAGDGRLAGIIRPNRAQCGMGEGNTYTRSLDEDYPSIGQLNKVLTDQQIIPIFAVTESVKNDYQNLSDSLTQLSSVGTLSDDSKDVVNLIREKLEDIVKKTQLNPRTPPGVSVVVTPKCAGEQTETTNGCFNVKMEEEVNFSIVVKVDQCYAEGNNTYNFDIEIPGISKIPVSLSVTCTCPCEDHVAINSTTCLESGDLVCGACQCYGDAVEGSCVDDSGDVCGREGYGRCVCGRCDCYDQRYGDYCECSDSTCPRDLKGTLCSGNGDCSCNLCQCDVANGSVLFTGEDCGCRVSKDECKQDLLECSGPSNGECVCGECQCKPGHTGKYCDICQECGPLDCSLHVGCVKCVHGGGSDNCECPGEAELSNSPTINSAALQGRHKQCPPVPDELDETCDINFVIEYTDYGSAKQRTLNRILIDRQLDCPTPPNIVAIVAGGVGGILTVGVLLLVLWKVYTSLVDKREYNKFLDERSSAKWNSAISPVYKNPTTIYANPLYTATIEE